LLAQVTILKIARQMRLQARLHARAPPKMFLPLQMLSFKAMLGFSADPMRRKWPHHWRFPRQA